MDGLHLHVHLHVHLRLTVGECRSQRVPVTEAVCATGRSSHSFLWHPEPVPVVVPSPKVKQAVASDGFPWLSEPVPVLVPSAKATEAISSHGFPWLRCWVLSLGFRGSVFVVAFVF